MYIYFPQSAKVQQMNDICKIRMFFLGQIYPSLTVTTTRLLKDDAKIIHQTPFCKDGCP